MHVYSVIYKQWSYIYHMFHQYRMNGLICIPVWLTVRLRIQMNGLKDLVIMSFSTFDPQITDGADIKTLFLITWLENVYRSFTTEMEAHKLRQKKNPLLKSMVMISFLMSNWTSVPFGSGTAVQCLTLLMLIHHYKPLTLNWMNQIPDLFQDKFEKCLDRHVFYDILLYAYLTIHKCTISHLNICFIPSSSVLTCFSFSVWWNGGVGGWLYVLLFYSVLG